MLTAFQRETGVTLIELLVGVAILIIAAAIGLPSFATWIQNTQIRTAAESATSGLQNARAEAVRRNTPVMFVISGTGGTGTTAWQVEVRNTAEILLSQTAGEGARNVNSSVIPQGSTIVTFNGLGRRIGNPDNSDPIDQINFDSSTISAAESRELRITITSGGEIRMCDPNVSDSSDPRSC